MWATGTTFSMLGCLARPQRTFFNQILILFWCLSFMNCRKYSGKKHPERTLTKWDLSWFAPCERILQGCLLKYELWCAAQQESKQQTASPKLSNPLVNSTLGSSADDVTGTIIPKPKPQHHFDETSSVASDSSLSHTHVRLSMFVLYVSDVKSSWPESGRSRKVVDIDEAIRMCESRPEFAAALKEVKERNLHHLPENVVHPSNER